MKAMRIDLTPYKIQMFGRSPILEKLLLTPGVLEAIRESSIWSEREIENLLDQQSKEHDYKVKQSITNVLFSLKMSSREAWQKRDPLADKIEGQDGKVLLSKEEYEMLTKAFDQFDRPGRNEEELLRRIYGAKEVDVDEKERQKTKK